MVSVVCTLYEDSVISIYYIVFIVLSHCYINYDSYTCK